MGYVDSIDPASTENVGLFAVPAMFITFRETLEAAIIISVLLGLLDKLELPQLKRFVWMGVLAASVMCVAAAIIVLILVNIAKEELFQGDSGAIAEGVISIIAAVLIAVVATTIGNVMALHDKWENLLASEMEREDAISRNSILFLSFTAVIREGLETILFFVGIGAAYPTKSLPIPAVVGAVLGVICGVALYRFGGRMTIKLFFRFTMVLLVFIGAGVFTNGIHELQEAQAFGTYPGEGLNKVMFDISECCGLTVSEFWLLMRVLFGYQPEPTGLEWIFYCAYHLVVWLAIALRYYLKMRKSETDDDSSCSLPCLRSNKPTQTVPGGGEPLTTTTMTA